MRTTTWRHGNRPHLQPAHLPATPPLLSILGKTLADLTSPLHTTLATWTQSDHIQLLLYRNILNYENISLSTHSKTYTKCTTTHTHLQDHASSPMTYDMYLCITSNRDKDSETGPGEGPFKASWIESNRRPWLNTTLK